MRSLKLLDFRVRFFDLCGITVHLSNFKAVICGLQIDVIHFIREFTLIGDRGGIIDLAQSLQLIILRLLLCHSVMADILRTLDLDGC